MEELFKVLDELLQAYERSTQDIDQALVNRVLEVRQRMARVVAMRRGLRSILPMVLLLLVGCHRRNDDGYSASGPSAPGSGSTVVTNYSGTIAASSCGGQTCHQYVTTNADVAAHPYDSVGVWLCRNWDCRASVPATNCTALPVGSTDPCYRTIPAVNIELGRYDVAFVNADQAGYSTYAIQTVVHQ